jgi:hypothetical protein
MVERVRLVMLRVINEAGESRAMSHNGYTKVRLCQVSLPSHAYVGQQ